VDTEKEIEHHLTFEYNQITPDIFLGTTMCCQTHFDEELIIKGVKADISIEAEKVDTPFGVDYFTWLPTPDNSAPTQEQLSLGATTIKNLIDLGEKVYVHCRFGHGRGPTMVAAYLISEGKTTEEALALIKEKREVIHPNDIQIAALKKFEESLKR